MFGELLPVDAFACAPSVSRGRPGVLVAVGSSLQVWPVAGLPAATVRAGGALAIVNDEPTGYDDEAALLVRGRAGEALARRGANPHDGARRGRGHGIMRHAAPGAGS